MVGLGAAVMCSLGIKEGALKKFLADGDATEPYLNHPQEPPCLGETKVPERSTDMQDRLGNAAPVLLSAQLFAGSAAARCGGEYGQWDDH